MELTEEERRRRGAAIKQWRMAQKPYMSHERLAAITGYDRGTISDAEKGSPSTKPETLERLEAQIAEFDKQNGTDDADEPSPAGLVMTVGGVRFEYPGHPSVKVETRADGTQIISIAGEPVPDVSRFVNEHQIYRRDDAGE